MAVLVSVPSFVLSAVLLAAGVAHGLSIVAPERLGELDGVQRLLLGGLVGVASFGLAWVAAVLLARTVHGFDAQQRVLNKVSLVFALDAVGLWASFLSWDLSRSIWRGRFLLACCAVGLTVGLSALLLRSEAHELLRRSSLLRRAAVPLVVVASAALFVLVGEGVLDTLFFFELRHVPDYADVGELLGSYVLNVLLVAALIGIAWGLSNRFLFASTAVGGSYLLLMLVDWLKLRTLKTPVLPLDVLYLAELRSVLADFVEFGWMLASALLVVALVSGAALSLRSRLGRLGARARVSLAAASFATLVAVTVWTASPGWTSYQWDGRRASLAQGFLAHFWSELGRARVEEPAGYDATAIERIWAGVAPPASDRPAERPDLVLLMVESLMDPDDLGLEFTEDPLPFLHALMRTHTSGYVLSPTFGGQSANPEFELLTGLSMRFLPRGSLPYRQYVIHELPALPRSLAERGYRSVALQVDPPSFFNRPACYPRLGFDETVWLGQDAEVELDASGRCASDEAVVDAILGALEHEGPTFVFAFTNATHAPYSRERFAGPGPEVVTDPESSLAIELGGYLRALHAMDRALERLVERVAARGEPAVIAILGDHQPSFTFWNDAHDASSSLAGDGIEALRRKHSVPVVLWSNVGEERREIFCSMNYLTLEILREAGLEPDPFQRFLGSVYARVPVLGPYAQTSDGSVYGSLEEIEAHEDLLRDYRLIQYDLLFGQP